MSFVQPPAEPAPTPSPVALAVEGGAQKGSGKNVSRYRNAATGETWSGRGLQPRWLKAAIAAGGKLTDHEVKEEKSKAASGGKAKKKPASPAADATGELFGTEV